MTERKGGMVKRLKLGSLFDGSGGFPLAGVMHGIEPVWASEIEPFPIRVTKLRFPNMKHLGSVTDVDGAKVEPVDIITFGSPCQDLSVAGKQAGIHEGQRSNLFFEAVRIIKEMRNATTNQYPRFAVWENVPGAFSSNKGEDFRAVLQALCEIGGGYGVSVPMPAKSKWLPAGCVVGNGWSVAWRIYDAQFWGVPQRRKRIYLIADFGSERAGEILFKPESVSGNPEPGGKAGKGTSGDAEGSAGGSDRAGGFYGMAGATRPISFVGGGYSCTTGKQASHDGVCCLNPWDSQSQRQYSAEGRFATLQARENSGLNRQGVCYALDSMASNSMKSANPNSGFHEEPVTKTLDTNPDPTCNQGGNVIVQPAAFMGGQGAKARSIAYCDDGSTPTIKSVPSGGNTVPDVVYPINTMVATRGGKDDMRTCFGIGEANDPQFTLSAAHEHGVCYAMEGNTVDRDSKKNGCGYCKDVSPTLNTQDKHAVTYAIEGNGARKSHQGNGYKETDKMYTLNTTEQHAVAYGIDQQGGKSNAGYGENVSPTLCAISHGTPNAVCFQQNQREEVRDMGEKAGTVTAESGMHNTNYLVLNDQGGSMMDVSDKAGCLRAQEHGHQPVVCYGVDCRNGVLDEEKTHTLQAKPNGGFSLNCTPSVLCYEGQNICTDTDKTFTIQAGRPDDHHIPSVVYSIENHPADSRVTIRDDNKCQTLTSRMGTGGNNVPMVLEVKDE